MELTRPAVIRDLSCNIDQTLLHSPHECVIEPRKGILKRRQPGFSPQYLIFKPRLPRLECPSSVVLAYGEPKGRIDPQKIYIIAVLIPSRHLIHPLPDHLKLSVFAGEPTTWHPPTHSRYDPRCRIARLSDAVTENQCRRDLGPVKIYRDCSIEFRSNCLSLFFNTPGYLNSHDSGLFPSLYHGIGRQNILFFFLCLPARIIRGGPMHFTQVNTRCCGCTVNIHLLNRNM
jgi:hypothetical protein